MMSGEQLVCPQCSNSVHADDQVCPHCHAPLETVIRRRAGRGRRYVYGKRKAGLSPEVIWLLVVVVLGLLIIAVAQLFAFMRARKLVHNPAPAVHYARVDLHRYSAGVAGVSMACKTAPASSGLWPRRTSSGWRTRCCRDSGKPGTLQHPPVRPPIAFLGGGRNA